jgi:hypothetical protein
VPVGANVACAGSFTLTQDIMEQGPVKNLCLSVSSNVTDALQSLAAPAETVGIPVLITPRLTVEVLASGCVTPFKAGELCCVVS